MHNPASVGCQPPDISTLRTVNHRAFPTLQKSGGLRHPARLEHRVAGRRWSARLVGLFLICGLGISTIAGCRPVPQVLTDEAVFGELDAFYTAVTTKRRDLLGDCVKRLTQLHTEVKLSDAGFAEVEAIAKLTEADKWTAAAERLYTFMRGQRKSATD